MVFQIILSVGLLYIVNKIFNLRNLFNPFVFVVLIHFFFFYIGLIYKNVFTHITITNETSFIINYGFISVIIGGIVSRFLFQKIKISYLRFPYSQIRIPYNSTNAIIGYVFLILGLVCTIKFIYGAGGIVVFMNDIENARIEARKGQGLVTQLAINFFTYGLLTFMVTRFNKSIKFIVATLVFAFIVSLGNRGPALYLLVFALMIWQSSNTIQFSYKKIMAFGVFLFSVMVLLGALRTNSQGSITDLFMARFAWRPFVNIQNFQSVMNYFPAKHDFLWGQTYLIDFSMLLPGSHPNSGTFLKELMDWKFDGGSVTPSYLGISYINFGYYGLVFSPFLLGFVSNSFYEVYSRILNLNRSINLILLLFLSFNFAAIVPSGVMTVLIQNLTVLFVVHVLYLLLLKVPYLKNVVK